MSGKKEEAVQIKREDLMQKMAEFIVQGMVERPDGVNVNVLGGQQNMIVEIDVDPSDYGFVVGRGGQNIEALRQILRATTFSRGKTVSVEVLDHRSEEEIQRLRKQKQQRHDNYRGNKGHGRWQRE